MMLFLKVIIKLVVISFNKNLINDEIKLSRVKTKGGSGGDRTPPKKQKSTRDLLIEFMGEQREFNKSAMQRFEKIEKEVSSLRNDFDRVIELNELQC